MLLTIYNYMMIELSINLSDLYKMDMFYWKNVKYFV